MKKEKILFAFHHHRRFGSVMHINFECFLPWTSLLFRAQSIQYSDMILPCCLQSCSYCCDYLHIWYFDILKCVSHSRKITAWIYIYISFCPFRTLANPVTLHRRTVMQMLTSFLDTNCQNIHVFFLLIAKPGVTLGNDKLSINSEIFSGQMLFPKA